MESKEFKSVIANSAKRNGFAFLHGGWFKESSECILVLCLQRSNFGKYYYLNIKIYIQGSLGRSFCKSKDLVKNMGNAFTRQPKEYDDLFNLELPIEDNERKEGLERFFSDYLNAFSVKVLTREGIKELESSKLLFVPSRIKEDLGF